MPDALILSGGILHDFASTTACVLDILAEIGMSADVTEDVEAGLAELPAHPRRLLVVNCLRFRMEAERYAEQRSRWAFSLPAAGRDAIRGHLAAGGGVLGLHTAVISFDDWPEWGDVLGAAWVWGRSGHPPRGVVRAEPAGVRHPVTEGLAGFAVEDELYQDLAVRPDVQPLFLARGWPLVWVREVLGGRVAVDLLGDQPASLTEPCHRELLRRLLAWAAGLALPTAQRVAGEHDAG